MSFDQSRRLTPDQSANDPASSRNSDGTSKSGQAGDMRDLVRHVASSKKIEANRKNALRSTGPRTRRGKTHARLNALKHGAFATQRLIRGEDAKAYEQLSERVFAEARPKTVIESMLADQIVGDMWRLRRVEQAERAYFEQVRAAVRARTLRALSAAEAQLLPEIVDGTKSPIVESIDAMSRSISRKLRAAMNPDKLMLDSMAAPDIAFPYSTLEHIRRSLVHDILRKAANLVELQDQSPTIASI